MFYQSSVGRQPKRLSRGLHVSRPCLPTAILPPHSIGNRRGLNSIEADFFLRPRPSRDQSRRQVE